MHLFFSTLLLLFAFAGNATAAGKLEIRNAWIRTAPPGAMMLAGYAILHNAGDAPIVIEAAHSDDFGDVSLHESVEENGVARMRELGPIEIAPGKDVLFAPGGKHFMLMQPKRQLKAGDKASIVVSTRSGETSAEFTVRDGSSE